MSSNEDTASTAEDFNSLEVTDPGPRTQTSRSNIVGSSSYDPQFTADSLENRFGAGTAQNFMSPENFAQTTQGGAGDTAQLLADQDRMQQGQISVPTIQAATTSPTFQDVFARGDLANFQSGVRDDSLAARGMVEGAITPESGPLNMLEAAIASRPRDFSYLDLIPTTGFAPAQVTRSKPTDLTSALALSRTLEMLDEERDRKAGMGDERGIDFGVTQQILPTPRPVDEIAARAMPGTAMDTRTTDSIAQEIDASGVLPVVTPDIFDPDVIGGMDTGTTTTGTGTTTTGTGTAQFDASPGRLQAEFGPRVASLAGGLEQQKVTDIADLTNREGTLARLGLPSFLASRGDALEKLTRDRMAEAIARGKTDPFLGKGFDITDKNIIRDRDGRVIGIRDNQGNLVEGMDPDAPQQGDDGGEQQTNVGRKAPTDPCPEGYQLVNGACTPVSTDESGTGFVTFPPDRVPSFLKGPFTAKTVATNPTNIRAFSPVTFGIPSIFKR